MILISYARLNPYVFIWGQRTIYIIYHHALYLINGKLFIPCSLFPIFYLIIEYPEPPKFCELRNDTGFEVVCTAGEYQPQF